MNRPLLLAALAVAACSPDFGPASRIEKLRVLAVSAEPPELDPAGVRTAALRSLVLRADVASRPEHVTTVVHLACVPGPGQVAPSPCVLLASLADPTALLAEAAPASCGGGIGAAAGVPAPLLAGVEACAGDACGPAVRSGGETLPGPAVTVPAGFYDPSGAASTLPADSPEWILGAQVVVLAFAVDATPDELGAPAGGACPGADLVANVARLWRSREHVLSTKRVRIRAPRAIDPPNRNPAIAGIEVSGAVLDPAAPTPVAAGERQLLPVLPAGAAGAPEVYTELDAAGVPIETRAEEWVYSWFSTAGDLEDLHTRSATAPDRWTVTASGPARVAVVVRDLRGGTSWSVRDVVVGQ